MLELFLTSFLKDGADFERASAILHGLTNMPGWESKHRVLYFSGPLPPKGFSVLRSVSLQQQQAAFGGPQQQQRPPPLPPQQQKALWDELNQNLSKTSFVVQARYEIFLDRDFVGATSVQEGARGADQPVDFNKTNGTLRWTDFPKPAEKHDRAPITQRKRVEIPDQKNLVAVFKDNSYRFKSEAIEESISYFNENLEYVLLRHYHIPANSDRLGPQPFPGLLPSFNKDESTTADSEPTTTNPPQQHNQLKLVDESGTWTLLVKIAVQEENAPDKVNEALAELQAAQKRLGMVFDWKVVDRRAHDTRILQPVALNAPAPMPQAQRVSAKKVGAGIKG